MKMTDLSGIWTLNMTAETLPDSWPLRITLPGTTTAAGLGPVNDKRETGFMTDPYYFEGKAWYRRTFETEDTGADTVMLTMERTRKTTVLIDGTEVGSNDSLNSSHRYFLPRLTAGTHELTVMVENRDYPTGGGHMTSPDTQGNWNGITGEISLTVGRVIPLDVRVLTNVPEDGIRVICDLAGMKTGSVQLWADGLRKQVFQVTNGHLDAMYIPETALSVWDEYSPELHILHLDTGDGVTDTVFGVRRLTRKGRKLYNNGRELFLRGKHDGLLNPDTGYPPTDEAYWLKILGIAKEYGINHYRFHTCCPPDALFRAADRLGIFLSPELPFWGTVTDAGEKGHNAGEHAYLVREGFRILTEFGHHPSFAFMSMGNELWGSKKVLNRMLSCYRAYDPDRMYISGANNFQFVPEVLDEEDVFVGVRFSRERLIRGSYGMCDAPLGIVQSTEPESASDYDGVIVPRAAAAAEKGGKIKIQYGTGVKEVEAGDAEAVIPEKPVISHEIGQYACYPDFRESVTFHGTLRPRYLEVFRERLEAAGLYGEHERFFRCSGLLAAACYRREIETALRTEELSGFQLLDLQDFTGQGVALVGMLNARMENKGLITAEEWRRFCSDTVVLGLLERFVFTAGETVDMPVWVSASDPGRRPAGIRARLEMNGRVLAESVTQVRDTGTRLMKGGHACFRLPDTDTAQKLNITLTAEDGTYNEYPVTVLPVTDTVIDRNGIRIGEGFVRFADGSGPAGNVPEIVIPDSEGKLTADYCTDFWNYPMFSAISESMKRPLPVGTYGLCVEKDDPLLALFPAEEYTTPVWYPILKHAHCEPAGGARPVVQMIDNILRCGRLGILYEKDGRVFLTARLWEDPGDPAVKLFARSLALAILNRA